MPRAIQLEAPIRLAPGQSVGVYIHSALFGDRGIVYSDQRGAVTHEDMHLQLLPGERLLSAVCCLLSAACSLLSAACCLLSTNCCLLSAGCCLP